MTNTHTHNPVYTYTHTHLMVTTWLDQNKASGPPLFSAELVFLKVAQSQGEFSSIGVVLVDSNAFICSPCMEMFEQEEKHNDWNVQLLAEANAFIPLTPSA